MAGPPNAETRRLFEQLLEAWPAHVQHVSASSINTFLRCPETYRRRYVLKQKAPPNSNMLWGSADHAAIEHNFRQKITTERDVSVREVQEVYANELDRRVLETGAAAVDWKADKELVGDKGPRQAWALVKDKGAELVGVYQRRVSPLVTPKTIEREFRIELADVPAPIIGRIDMEAEVASAFTLGPQPEVILDRKTAARRAFSGEWYTQAAIYQLERELPVGIDLSMKTKVPYVHPHFFEPEKYLLQPGPPARTLAMLKRAMVGIGNCYVIFGRDQPWPGAKGHPWACDYCGFRSTCPWWTEDFWAQGTLLVP